MEPVGSSWRSARAAAGEAWASPSQICMQSVPLKKNMFLLFILCVVFSFLCGVLTSEMTGVCGVEEEEEEEEMLVRKQSLTACG